jgi:hypothetical protein
MGTEALLLANYLVASGTVMQMQSGMQSDTQSFSAAQMML